MNRIDRILIVGGGIGGMTTAIAAAQHGFEAEIVEIQRETKVYGVGIIQPSNALRALDAIGLAEACLAAGGGIPGWEIRTAQGALLAQVPNRNVVRPGFPPINGIARPELHRILAEAVAAHGIRIRPGTTVSRLDDDGTGVDVEFSDGTQARYDLVVGADGAHSAMRARLFGDALQPQLTGQSVWRYNLPRPANMEWGALYYGAASKAGLVPISKTMLYMLLVTAEAGNPWMPTEGLAARMRERLAEYGGLVGTLGALITDDAEVVYRPMESVLVPSPWRRGRVCLIGDAAHCTTPHLAQGAALAIEDGVLLAELLASARPFDAVFDEFMHRRFARARLVVDASLQLGAWEMAQWQGSPDPDEHASDLLHEATEAMMETY